LGIGNLRLEQITNKQTTINLIVIKVIIKIIKVIIKIIKVIS